VTTDNQTTAKSGLTGRRLLLGLAVICLVYGVSTFLLGGEAVLDALARVPLGVYGLVLSCSLFNYFLRYRRWAWFLARRGHKLPFGTHGLIYVAGFAYTATPGKIGEALRGIYLKDYGVPLTRTVAAVGAERLADLMSMALLTLAIVAASPYVGWGFAAALGLTTLAAWALHSGLLMSLVGRFIGSDATSATLDDLKSYLTPGVFLSAILIGLMGWGLEGAGFHLILAVLGVDITPLTAIGIYAAASLLGALSFMPGGIGGAEAVMTGLLIARGVDASTAFAATLICRGATLWFGVLLGFLATLLVQMKARPSHMEHTDLDPSLEVVGK